MWIQLYEVSNGHVHDKIKEILNRLKVDGSTFMKQVDMEHVTTVVLWNICIFAAANAVEVCIENAKGPFLRRFIWSLLEGNILPKGTH